MRACALGALLLAAAVGGGVFAQAPSPFPGILDEHPAIQYRQRPARDRVSALKVRIAERAASLRFRENGGYLHSMLGALGVPAESQLLVFSKTGVQSAATSPTNPRAIFFNDSAVVGYVPGARFLEIAAHDPEQGVQFYTVDQTLSSEPVIQRRTECLACHVSSSTLDVPGMINRSVFTDAQGRALPQLGSFTVDHRTRLLDRWGGMYVTGDYTLFPYNVAVHMGNVTTVMNGSSGPMSSNEAFIQWINSAAEARGYAGAESDIAAFMAFDHQMHAINLLTRLNWEARVNGPWREIADELADYLLFVGEAPPPARVKPRSGFAEQFAVGALQDRQGRSLRELDLEKRLLRYPCSYMVYSAAFDSLPAAAKGAVYERMWSVLSGKDRSAKYAHLSAVDRRAIIEILRETKQDLPAIFHAQS
jgi:hypothetical protein